MILNSNTQKHGNYGYQNRLDWYPSLVHKLTNPESFNYLHGYKASFLHLGNASLDISHRIPVEEGEEMEGSIGPTNDIVTFIFEGIVLLIVALVGLAGNFASFITICSQKVQKTFHSLLFLLSIFDMVRILVQKCKNVIALILNRFIWSLQ